MFTTPSARRVLGAALAAGALSVGVAVGTPSAAAGPEQDQRYQEFVEGLGIPTESPEQVGQIAMGICSTLDTGKIEPARTVRGIIASLTSKGMTKSQATNMVVGAVEVYCPQFNRIVGR